MAAGELAVQGREMCIRMESFFELAEAEIRRLADSDTYGLEFLLRGAKAEVSKFSEAICDVREGAENEI